MEADWLPFHLAKFSSVQCSHHFIGMVQRILLINSKGASECSPLIYFWR